MLEKSQEQKVAEKAPAECFNVPKQARPPVTDVQPIAPPLH